MDLKPLVYACQVTRGETPSIFVKVSTGSSNNVKPELFLETYCNECGFPFSPFTFEIQREEIYAPGFVPLNDLGENIE